MSMAGQGPDSGGASWERTTADENRRYREAVLGTRLSRAATAADVLASRLVEGQTDDMVRRIAAIRDHVLAHIDSLLTWTEPQFGAYLMSVTWPGVERGQELVKTLESLIAAAGANNIQLLRDEAAAVTKVARLLSEES